MCVGVMATQCLQNRDRFDHLASIDRTKVRSMRNGASLELGSEFLCLITDRCLAVTERNVSKKLTALYELPFLLAFKLA